MLADQRDALAEVLVDRATRIDQLLAKIVGLQADMARLQATRAFQLAQAVAEARRSWRGALRLPMTLWRLAFRDRTAVADDQALPVPEPVAVAVAASGPAGSAEARAPTNGHLRVAAIVDALSELALAPECALLQLEPDDFAGQLDAFRPDVLFVESAWFGARGRWADSLVPVGDALLGVLAHCRRNGVPTVFWNKEDPVHHDYFLALSRHFDFVFTTDSACVEAYQRSTGRRDIRVLPFACQPRVHHPVAECERMDAFVFAGSYYRQHARRSSDFDRLAAAAAALRPVHIYDRNYGRQHPDFSYPERWRSFVRGCMEPCDVPGLYRAYRYALNVNTIQDSPTMFARRVFELLACGTPIVSNGSQGESKFFPALTISAAEPGELERAVARLVADEPYQHRLRTSGIRQVMSTHTWKHRLDTVCRVVGLPRQIEAEPTVLVVARAHSPLDTRHLLEMFRSQTYSALRCLIVADHPASGLGFRERIVSPEEAEGLELNGLLVAGWFPRDTYGPNYVSDLALARRYSGAVAIGKATYFARVGDGVESRGDGLRYHPVESLACRRSLVIVPSGALIDARRFADSLESGRIAPGGDMRGAAVVEVGHESGLLSVDEFNYCEEGNGFLPPVADDALR